MKKVVSLLVKAFKNLYDKRKKHIQWITIAIEFFFHLSRQKYDHLMRKSCPLYQVCSKVIDNDDIDQCANAII